VGGPGSGLWYRWDKRECLDDNFCIDVRRWKRDGMLSPGARFHWQWAMEGEVMGSIRVRVEVERIVLVYRLRASGGNWRPVEEPVRLTYTPCNFGGQRVWFQCAGCGERAAKLYSQIPPFKCRRCCDTRYQSQSETPEDRAMRKDRRIRHRLGASSSLAEPILSKPRGMHRTTFHRLQRAAEDATLSSLSELARQCEQLGEEI
jgi:hypothetical protein